MPNSGRVLQIVNWRGLFENCVPFAEASLGEIARWYLRHRHLTNSSDRHRGFEIARDFRRAFAVAFHHVRRPQELNVVRVVHHGIHALGISRAKVKAVGLDSADVGIGGSVVVTDPKIDVRRHVHQVSGRGHQLAKPLCAGECASRIIRSFHRVDIVVIRADMAGILRDHTLERRDNFVGAGDRGAVRVPESPRMQVHHRFGEQRARVGIVRIPMRHVAHCVGIRLLKRVVHLAVGRVALCQRLDILALRLARVRFE